MMIRTIFFFVALLVDGVLLFAKPHQTMIIRYQSSSNGIFDEQRYKEMTISKGVAQIKTIDKTPYEKAPEEEVFINFNHNVWYQKATLHTGESYTVKRNIQRPENWEISDSASIIQGFKCKKATLIVNSNTITIWFSEETSFFGTPQPRYGIPNALILKISINGNRTEEAVEITYRNEAFDHLLPNEWGLFIEPKQYVKLLNESGVVKIKVFDNEIVEFNPDLIKPADFRQDKVYHVGNGAVILRKIVLPKSADGYDIFAELVHHAEKDAYDRTGSVFLIPTDKKRSFLEAFLYGMDTLPSVVVSEKGKRFPGIVATDDYNPPIEMMRFFTAFGVSGYGYLEYGDYKWADSVVYKQEVTHLSQYLEQEAWIAVFIGNWTKHAHRVSLSLQYYPQGKGGQYRVTPLFNTLNVREMEWQEMPELFLDDAFAISFTLSENLADVKFAYLSTGHGGWGGGDEFNQKTNTIWLDKNFVAQHTPWREDCAGYRLLNPASGNFRNGISSSDYSRSGWCPGTVTNPAYFTFPPLSQGLHSLKIAIPQGAPEGNSHSNWSVSGILIY